MDQAPIATEDAVFRAAHLGLLTLPNNRSGWHRRQVGSRQPFAEEASRLGIYLLPDNLWEDDPNLITTVLAAANDRFLKVCRDFAHATFRSGRCWIYHRPCHDHQSSAATL